MAELAISRKPLRSSFPSFKDFAALITDLSTLPTVVAKSSKSEEANTELLLS